MWQRVLQVDLIGLMMKRSFPLVFADLVLPILQWKLDSPYREQIRVQGSLEVSEVEAYEGRQTRMSHEADALQVGAFTD